MLIFATHSRGLRGLKAATITQRLMNKEHNTSITQKWLDGISYEVAFWNNVYRWPHTFKGMMGWADYGSVINLEGFDANSFLASEKDPKVYDVGCGMSYAVGNNIQKDGRMLPLDIHYVDPLAIHFNSILRKHGKQLPPIEFGMAEYLSAFVHGDATLITIQNALDHSSAPVKGIVEALTSLKEGGILYLNHHPNEAEMEQYKGFHQYNINEENSELIIWNKAERYNISQMLGSFASVEVRRMDNGHIIAVIKRRAAGGDIPPHLRKYIDDNTDLAELCEVLLRYQYTHSSLLRNIKDSLHFGLFNLIQMVAQMLPWSLKMKVKRWIKQA